MERANELVDIAALRRDAQAFRGLRRYPNHTSIFAGMGGV